MKEYNKYVRKWQDIAIKMNEAMQKDDFKLADELMSESVEAYNRYKELCSYKGSNREMSFGELNQMFESAMPTLFKENKKALGECARLIKEDSNLRSAFRFIDALRKYNCDGDANSYVNECLSLASSGIDKKSFKESVEKLADKLALYEVGGYKIDEDESKYFKACDKVLCEDKKLSNMTEFTNSMNSISSYIEEHKAPIRESIKSMDVMVEELGKKIANMSEEEQSLVQDIIDFKAPMVEDRQRRLLEKLKGECLGIIGGLIEGANTDELSGLNAIKEQIEKKDYCKETIVLDIANLLEIRDVLMEK